MSWVLLRRTVPCEKEVILVSERSYELSGGVKLYKWDELARGSDADYNMLLKMAELTGHYVELQVNRDIRMVTNVSED